MVEIPGSSEASEESSDWEVIQHPFDHQPSSPPPQGQLLDYDFVLRDNFYDSGGSVFPPSEHEDLPLVEDFDSQRITSAEPSCSDIGAPKEQQIESYSKLSVTVNEIRTRTCTIGKRVFQVFLCSISRKGSSIFSATALVVALLACMKILQWRNRLLLLIKERDQRISQLLNQIARMNEILSARRKVPIFLIK